MITEELEEEQIQHGKITGYNLLAGDLLVKEENGKWTKECPGTTIMGFELTEEQEAKLRPVDYEHDNLDYVLTNPEDKAFYESLG